MCPCATLHLHRAGAFPWPAQWELREDGQDGRQPPEQRHHLLPVLRRLGASLPLRHGRSGHERQLCLYPPVLRRSGERQPTVAAHHTSSQYGDNCGYSCFGYDALGRQTESTMPGVAWHAGSKKKMVSYITNTSADNTSYSYGLLTGEQITDEDGHIQTTFYNLQGQKVQENRGTGNRTRYIYNDLGQLTGVLMPGHNSADPNYTSYSYEYDTRGRITRKRFPGTDYIQYWYDDADRVAFMQDGMLRQKGRYRFMLYDAFGRLAIQGTCSGAGVSAVSSVVPTATFTQNSGGLLSTDYVVSNGVSITDPTLEIVNYYDGYTFLSGSMSTMFSPVSAQSGTCVKGLSTGSVTAVSNGGFIYSLNLYDGKGRMVEARSTMPDVALTERLTTAYSFTGNPLSEEYLLSRTGQGTVFIAHADNTYFTANDRLHTATLQVGVGSSMPTSSRTIQTIAYNDLGQVTAIVRPGSAGTVSYGYDLHGWVTGINTPSFKEELYYASDGDCSGTPCYNGNVSVQKWSNGNYAQKRGYKFTYDALNRLTDAVYGERDALSNCKNYYNEQILEYYPSGAVKRLQRRGRKDDGHSGKIDNLHITVKGNRLHYVSDDAAKLHYDGAFDFNGDASNGSAYQYNANGSLVTDTGKGIMFIEYDDNGMPRRIQFADGNVTEYVYAATGRKLRTVYYTAIPGITVGSGETHQLTASEILSKDSIDYLGSLTLVNGVLGQYFFPGGYCQLNEGNVSGNIGWHYYNRDHLGNNREVVSEGGTLEQVTNYYPFGAPFCERTTAGANTNATLQRYKYNGKELDLMHTWNGIDPMCEDYYPISPYAYCANNPVNRFDPDGRDWYSSLDSIGNINGQAIWQTQIHYTDCISQEQLIDSNIYGTYLGKTVVLFDGYYDEKLGNDNTLDGPGSKYATATVYGENGPDDITSYIAFTMSSDFDKYGAIQDGIYNGSYAGNNKPNHIPKPYVLEKGGAINTIDGNRYKDGYSKDKKNGIFIHRTNNNGTANGRVSLGCLLIKAQQMTNFEKHVGRNSFKVILRRK